MSDQPTSAPPPAAPPAHAPAVLTPEQQAAQEAEAWRQFFLEQGELYEYLVVQVRETLIGDKINTSALQQTLSFHASQGWHVKTITSAQVAGRVGPGGVGGLIVVFERKIFK